jgi:coenzyme F420-0:L-glutamate ligase
MQLFRIRTKLIKPGDNLADIILGALDKQKLAIEDRDLLAIASKVVATVEGRLKKLSSVEPSKEAKKLARQYHLEPSFVEVVLQESELIHGGVSKALLTLKNNVWTANAGVDHKNVPKGCVALWPKNSQRSAEKICKEILKRTGKQVGVLIIDSRVTPLRMGTTGVALGIAGFEPLRDYRFEKDLYGNSISITRHAIADDIASAAHLMMGESSEQTPIILIKKAPVKTCEKVNSKSTLIPTEECLFTKLLLQKSITKHR